MKDLEGQVIKSVTENSTSVFIEFTDGSTYKIYSVDGGMQEDNYISTEYEEKR